MSPFLERQHCNISPIVAGALDIIALIAAAGGAHWLRFGHIAGEPDYTILVLPASLLFALICAAGRVYTNLQTRSPFARMTQLSLAFCASFSMVLGYLVFSKSSTDFSRLWLGYWMVLGFAALTLLRAGFSLVADRVYWLRPEQRQVMLVGDDRLVSDVIAKAPSLARLGYNVRKYVGSSRSTGVGTLCCDFACNVSHAGVREVWVCVSIADANTERQVVHALRNTTVEVRRILFDNELGLLSREVSEIGELTLLSVSCSPHRGGRLILKLLEDYVLGLLLFLICVPLFLVIAVAIKLDSRGPILFTQYRSGINGERFRIYKFRTMEWCGPVARHPNGNYVTRVGRLLRCTSLDELPQLYNVLQGKMSLVGPRPHATFHSENYAELVDTYMRRHLVKPGLTGWAQVNGLRGEVRDSQDVRRRVDHDLHYIENWSLWLDIKIMLMTPFYLVTLSDA